MYIARMMLTSDSSNRLIEISNLPIIEVNFFVDPGEAAPQISNSPYPEAGIHSLEQDPSALEYKIGGPYQCKPAVEPITISSPGTGASAPSNRCRVVFAEPAPRSG